MATHPLRGYFTTHFEFAEGGATVAMKNKWQEGEVRVAAVCDALATECDICNGFGHIATDK